MEETRVEKYKAYRSELISEGTPKLTPDRISEIDSSLLDTLNTKTIPIAEVYGTIAKQEQEQESLVKLEKQKMILKYTFLGIFLLLLAIGIVIFAIFAFKK
ncbi:MAG: hypothetical protein IJQ67_02585 [Bacilli bacterium]|nr:hypothetical protein [Bacilli bacterium]